MKRALPGTGVEPVENPLPDPQPAPDLFTVHRKCEVQRHAGKGHASTGKRVLAAKALGEPRDDVAILRPSDR